MTDIIETVTATEPVAALAVEPKLPATDTLTRLTSAILELLAPAIEQMVADRVAEALEHSVAAEVNEQLDTALGCAFESDDFSSAVESVVDSIEFTVEANIRGGYGRRR